MKKKFSFTIFGFVFLQVLVEVRSKVRAKHQDHLVQAHLAEAVAVHGAIGQRQGVGVKLGAVRLGADPLHHVFRRPEVRIHLTVPQTCARRKELLVKVLH